MINSSYVLARYLVPTAPEARLLVIGEEPLIQDLLAAGLTTTNRPEETDYVVISWDWDFHYRKLDAALQAVRRGARTTATNPDRTCPMQGGGEVPDAGMDSALVLTGVTQESDLSRYLYRPTYVLPSVHGLL